MASVDKPFAENIKSNNGYFNGDEENELGDNPRCTEITRYDNAFGGVGYGLTFEGQANVYVASEFVINPSCFWKYST